jgi:hypothetical protein
MRAWILTLVWLAGCGGEELRSCENACEKAFRSDQCNIQVPGVEASELIRDCSRECENALARTGELEGYDPDDLNSVDRSEPFKLKNEKQAALWIDCVVESACERLDEGFCPGGGIN